MDFAGYVSARDTHLAHVTHCRVVVADRLITRCCARTHRIETPHDARPAGNKDRIKAAEKTAENDIAHQETPTDHAVHLGTVETDVILRIATGPDPTRVTATTPRGIVNDVPVHVTIRLHPNASHFQRLEIADDLTGNVTIHRVHTAVGALTPTTIPSTRRCLTPPVQTIIVPHRRSCLLDLEPHLATPPDFRT
ncbi:hypothetical protein Q1695_012330 [Nippostrongylus brasiliensis]|nr:hypothetical protein Q1695_012330 [Nippostrongylus brasiliensis]